MASTLPLFLLRFLELAFELIFCDDKMFGKPLLLTIFRPSTGPFEVPLLACLEFP